MHGTQMAHFGADKPPADAVRLRLRQGRRAHGVRRRLRLHGQGRHRSGRPAREGHAPARDGAAQPHADGVVHRLGGRAHRSASRAASGDLHLALRRRGRLFREEVIMCGVVPLVAAMVGPGAAGTAYIPGLADFVPMVKDVGSMALGGPPLVKAVTGQEITEQELGGSKVHCREVGRRRRRGRGRCGVHRRHQGVPVVLPVALRGEAADHRRARIRSTAATSRCSTSCPSRRASRTTCTRSSSASSITGGSSTSSRGSRKPSSPAWRASAAGRSASSPTTRATWAASSPTTPPTRRRTSSRSATRSTSRSCSCWTCPASWSARKVEHEGIIRHGAKMLHAMARRRCRSSRWWCARATAPATT